MKGALKLIWSTQAREDLREIYLYIARDNPYAARAVQARIKEGVAFLKDNLHTGRPGRVPGIRELVIAQTLYIVPYRVLEDRLELLRVYHGARRWPASFSMDG